MNDDANKVSKAGQRVGAPWFNLGSIYKRVFPLDYRPLAMALNTKQDNFMHKNFIYLLQIMSHK